MRILLIVLYGLACYAIFLIACLAGVAFTGGWLTPALAPTVLPPPLAFLIDLVLLTLFGLQHSVMARASFKRRWTEIVPQSIERSTYVLLASLALLLIFWQWRPLPGIIWQVHEPIGAAVLWGLFAISWLIVVVATFLIDHLDLTGLRNGWDRIRGVEPAPSGLRTPGLYRLVRHPMMFGLLIAFWATPTLTTDRLLFALGMSAYILIGVSYEERDLLRSFGAAYAVYRRRVPMLLPRPGSFVAWRGERRQPDEPKSVS